MLDLNQLQLPSEVREKLAELDLELSEGDITQKGYEKKRAKLLTPYLNQTSGDTQLITSSIISHKNEKSDPIIHHVSRPTEHRSSGNHHFANGNGNSQSYGLYAQAGSTANSNAANHHLSSIMKSNNFSSPQTRANKRAHRRVTRNESRYHSEVRKEAVQQAIAAMKSKPKPAIPMPSKRNSNLSRGKDVRSKYNNNLRSSGRQRSHRGSHLQSSSGHGTAGDSETYESTDDDYDDEEDELMVNESSSGTPELNLKKIKNLTITMNHQNAMQKQQISLPHSSSEEASSSTASSSTQERQLNLSKHLKKQQQPLPLPPRVVAVQETSGNNYRGDHKSKSHHHNSDFGKEFSKNFHKQSSSSQPQTQLFQLKDRPSKHHFSSKSSAKNSYLNSPMHRGSTHQDHHLLDDDDMPPALPQHQAKLHHPNSVISSNQLTREEEQLLLSFEDRPPERTPKRVHSKQQSTEPQGAAAASSKPSGAVVEDLISLEPNSIESFNEPGNLRDTMMSSSSNNSSSNNNTSCLISGAIDEPLSSLTNNNHANNRSNNANLISSSSIDNLPPEYDQVYGDRSNRVAEDSHPGNRSPSSRSRISNDTSYSTGTGRYKVSAKIQQLLNTLKRPKKRPLDDFYKDDDCDLQFVDPNGPKPEGSTMIPIIGEQLQVPSGLPKTLEAALQRYGSATFKATAITVLDTNGKISTPLSYGKLLSRSKKIAYNLLNKVGQKRSSVSSTDQMPIKTGDRIALVFPNNDPIGFICAFYGCLSAGVVPVPVEVPITRRDSDSLQIGFLLGSCKVNYALTSEACFKGLPKTPTGEIHTFKGWPKLTWLVPEGWSKGPKDWQPPDRISEESVAYIEYTMDREGAMKGVSVTRSSMISHCRALTNACLYTEGDVMVCLLDFKREVGLWHSVLTSILNGIHVIFIPYALMKVNPSCWLQMITKFKATTAICKSRDLHWGLLSTKESKDINLASLRMLLVADGANPWSLSSCDQFLNVFNSKGLKSEALCPNASSTEAMTLSIRRPGRVGIGATGRGVLSMNALSYNVIRVDQENSLTSLTLQDCGHILPNSSAAVVKISGPPYRCKSDEVGEICISSFATECSYYGLAGLSENHFRMEILNADGSVYGDQKYARTGLLGFFGPGGLVFVCGTKDNLMCVNGWYHLKFYFDPLDESS